MRTLVFSSLFVQWWSFLDNTVYCNISSSLKAAFLEVEKATFTVATLAPMFTIITPGPRTRSKQSETFHAKFFLKLNCEKKCLWWPKLIVEELQISIIQSDLHALYLTLFCQLPIDFHDYCLFNMSDQLVVGTVFSCFRSKKYKKYSFGVTAWPLISTFAGKSHAKNK